ncbi:hypothetical protein, partial [Escherichia coli]
MNMKINDFYLPLLP